MFFTCSGTGGLEATVVNTFSINNKVLVFSVGYYGDIFADIARNYLGYNVTVVNFEPGTAISKSAVKDLLEREKFDAVLLTHCESSTGVLNPLAELTAMIREYSDALILVDAGSMCPVVTLRTNAFSLSTISKGENILLSVCLQRSSKSLR